MRWISTPESVKADEPAVLAIAETVLATVAYWWIAWAFDTHLHLLISIIVAPLLLLRSPESTAVGARWFHAYITIDDKIVLTPRNASVRFCGVLLLVAGGAAVGAYVLSQYLPPGHSGWLLFWRAFMVGVTASMIAVAVAVAVAVTGAGAGAVAGAVAIAGAGAVAGAAARAVAVAGAVAVAVAVAVMAGTVAGTIAVAVMAGTIAAAVAGAAAGAAAGAIAGAIAGAAAGAIAVAVAVAGARARAGAGAGAGAGAAAAAGAAAIAGFFLIPFSFGVWLRSLGVRIVATLRHLGPGWRALPDNWRHALLIIDSYHPPELVPGLKSLTDKLSFHSIIELIRTSRKFECIIGICFAPIFFLPALLYRWSLKSTCWLYLPLVYVFPGGKESEDGGRLLVSLSYRSRMETICQCLTLIVVVSVVINTALVPQMIDLHKNFPYVPVPLYLLAFDLSKLAPWQVIALLSAVITVIIFFFSDIAHRAWEIRKGDNPSAVPDPRHITLLRHLSRLRNICTWLFLIMAFGFTVLALTHTKTQDLPNWLSFLNTVYGPYLPQHFPLP